MLLSIPRARGRALDPWVGTLRKELYRYGERSSGEAHGVVLTRPHVVRLILDLAGYDPAARDLSAATLLEPAVGRGAFLLPVVERLLASCRRHRRDPRRLAGAILAFDVDSGHVRSSRDAVARELRLVGLSSRDARRLAAAWVVEGDFLLADTRRRFDFVCGNPPYVRIEQLAAALQAEYRGRFASLFDRADLYVAFIEKGLDLLAPGGRLSFICADRWTLNRYGAPLRRKISSSFRVLHYIDLHRASPFESEVIAYPAIFTIARGRQEEVRVARLETASEEECAAVARDLEGSGARHATWFEGDAPWVLSPPGHLQVLRDLERRFEPIEADGKTSVRIGVATGADEAFIVGDDAPIEPDRLVPLVKREDIERGEVRDGRRRVINTFGDDGSVIDLRVYPRLRRYLETRAALIKRRHVARKNPSSWFRTIDRVYPELVPLPKLLIPDIAGSNEVVLERGRYHPHHNLYFVISSSWDMEVLGGLLSSKVALFFVWSYAVKMRGRYLRFQAQYLRRIRVPPPGAIPEDLARDIRGAFRARDFQRLDELALAVYGLEALPAFDFADTRK